ncbi:hypothetical protein CY34DRAFT_800066 [Suillus luteus UH-Slu-Lm8-n1]|uniref:Unplaced genomic scaffold CY34scaffold_24, whole genome shotgun sequence n=1 Tax=Suillus luteus UH-Slu-Lm8-n1 TaxID=930992 RepID=A0A0D0BAG9_9AGAM|nr:hypothetical protein CY34DRAFT_800066 [Suillus luteus UH-Slu-Lm8-n1]
MSTVIRREYVDSRFIQLCGLGYKSISSFYSTQCHSSLLDGLAQVSHVSVLGLLEFKLLAWTSRDISGSLSS